jgi:hypothetical protein
MKNLWVISLFLLAAFLSTSGAALAQHVGLPPSGALPSDHAKAAASNPDAPMCTQAQVQGKWWMLSTSGGGVGNCDMMIGPGVQLHGCQNIVGTLKINNYCEAALAFDFNGRHYTGTLRRSADGTRMTGAYRANDPPPATNPLSSADFVYSWR